MSRRYTYLQLVTESAGDGEILVIDSNTDEVVLKLTIAAAERLSEHLAIRAIWEREARGGN